MTVGDSVFRVFLARRFTEPFDVALAEFLRTHVQPKVVAGLHEKGRQEQFEFVEAEEPHGGDEIPEKVSDRIRRSHAVLAVAFPDKQGRVAPWILEEIGIAYASGKPIRVLFPPREAAPEEGRRGGRSRNRDRTESRATLDPHQELGLVGYVGGEHLPIPWSRFDPGTFHPDPALADDVARWLVQWILTIAPVELSTFDYRFERYVKHVTVYPDGYGLVTVRVQARVDQAISRIPHVFGNTREDLPDNVLPLATLEGHFAQGGAHQRPRRSDVFSFRSLSPTRPTRHRAIRSDELPTHIRETVPQDKPAQWAFEVVSANGEVLQPGLYEYEYCYGLERSNPADFGKGATAATPRPVLIVDGSVIVHFACEAEAHFERAERLQIEIQYGTRNEPGFRSRPPEPHERVLSTQGLTLQLRSVLRPVAHGGCRLLVGWKPPTPSDAG